MTDEITFEMGNEKGWQLRIYRLPDGVQLVMRSARGAMRARLSTKEAEKFGHMLIEAAKPAKKAGKS